MVVVALIVSSAVACSSAESVAPETRALRPAVASPVIEPGTEVVEECPTNFIKYATIPGNLYPYHQVTVGASFTPLPFVQLLAISATGLEKGRYAIAGGGPWVSDDKEIAILSGHVDGWCRFKRFSNTTIYNYTGSLQVTAFDGEVIQMQEPPQQPQTPPPTDRNLSTSLRHRAS
jgi:hypothetical protein